MKAGGLKAISRSVTEGNHRNQSNITLERWKRDRRTTYMLGAAPRCEFMPKIGCTPRCFVRLYPTRRSARCAVLHAGYHIPSPWCGC